MNFESFSRETWNEGREREREERESESWHFLQASWREKEGRKKRENNRYTDEISFQDRFFIPRSWLSEQVTGRESNNPDNGGYIFFTLFFFSFFFPSLPYSSITLKTMLRTRSTAYRNALSLVTSRAKPVNYIFTPFDETSPPLLSLSLSLSIPLPMDYGSRPINRPAEK